MRDTVILTVFNRTELTLLNTLSALAMNDLAATEILICDDGSTLDYGSVWECFEAMPIRRVSFQEPEWVYSIGGHNNPAVVNNWIVANLPEDCERVFWLSSDTMLSWDALARAREWVDRGRVYVPRVMDLAYGELFCGAGRIFPMMWFAGMSLEMIRRVGGFDEKFCLGMAYEDTDFMARAFQASGGLVVDLGASAFHQSHERAYLDDGGAGKARNEEYIRSKWGGVPWSSDPGPKFRYESVRVGNHLILTPQEVSERAA